MGEVYLIEKDFAQAEQMFREATRLNPKLSEAHHKLGVALLGQARFGEAEIALTEALRLKPDLNEARQLLIRARTRQTP